MFTVIGIIDILFLRDKLGLGPEFMKGMEMIVLLRRNIVGIIAIVLEIVWHANLCEQAARSMVVTMILAINMGGFQSGRVLCLVLPIGNCLDIVYGFMGNYRVLVLL